MGWKRSVLRHSRDLFHFLLFIHSCVIFTHFLPSLFSASMPFKSQALSHLSWQAESGRKEKRSFCLYAVNLFQESGDTGVLLPVLNFVKLISKAMVDNQTAVL